MHPENLRKLGKLSSIIAQSSQSSDYLLIKSSLLRVLGLP